MHMLVLFCLVAISNSYVAASWNIVNKDLVGRVVHIESLAHRGEWWASRKNLFGYRWLGIKGSPERDVYFNDWTQFKVVQCDNGRVCFESTTFKNYYVSSESSNVDLKQSNYPHDKVWAQWTIYCENGKLDTCAFLSSSIGQYMGVKVQSFITTDKWAKTKPYDETSHFRILAPVPKDYMASILETENHSSLEQQKEITFYVGVSKTTTVSQTISASLSAEIGCAFAVGGASLSGSWTRETSKTFEKSRETRYIINMPPGARVNFKQLTGIYGPFKIASRKFVIECTMLSSNAPCMADSVSYSLLE